MREKLIELINKSMNNCPPNVGGCRNCPYFIGSDSDWCDDSASIADHLIANGVVVSKMETTTDKDRNVPSKVVPHKVENEPIRVGAGLWCKGTTVYKCPKCQTFVMRYCKYCFECGQALEWQTEPPKGE